MHLYILRLCRLRLPLSEKRFIYSISFQNRFVLLIDIAHSIRALKLTQHVCPWTPKGEIYKQWELELLLNDVKNNPHEQIDSLDMTTSEYSYEW